MKLERRYKVFNEFKPGMLKSLKFFLNFQKKRSSVILRMKFLQVFPCLLKKMAFTELKGEISTHFPESLNS